MKRTITLTTDFGLADGYIGAMKGVIVGINPNAILVDLAHEINAQDVFEAAFVLGTSYSYFPPNAIHIVVVDPGVGSERAALAIRTPMGTFVGPDNGVFTWPVYDSIDRARKPGQHRIDIPDGGPIEVVKLTEAKFWRPNPSSTFHGRDIFAPVAAYLSLGVSLESLGPRLSDVLVLPLPVPRKRSPTQTEGEILRKDRFGNLITNLRMSHIQELGTEMSFRLAGQEIQGLSRSYQEKSGLLALVGSSGYIEIALHNGSAAESLGMGPGDKVIAVGPTPPRNRGRVEPPRSHSDA